MTAKVNEISQSTNKISTFFAQKLKNVRFEVESINFLSFRTPHSPPYHLLVMVGFTTQYGHGSVHLLHEYHAYHLV